MLLLVLVVRDEFCVIHNDYMPYGYRCGSQNGEKTPEITAASLSLLR